jgi:diaminohydroxyphosphoribosylaminopyrimidine deaminase/5-amino-6-(5-phosphoribosylamino)uracil reductase
VIVKDGRIVGRGWTAVGGRPHAEARALDQAGPSAQGATAYVTLEPCAHQGQTPPCCQAIIKAGISRVVSASEDPDPRVSGQGHTDLEAAGIQVTQGVLQAEARRDHAGFLKRVTDGRPTLTLKLASSFDGRIATASGDSQWITGAQARRRTHAMRRSHDAVLIGGGTAREDDPRLTVREMGACRQPVRVVASRQVALSPEGELATSAKDVPLWLMHRDGDPSDADAEAWQAKGARLFAVSRGTGGFLDPHEILQTLGNEGITRVFCEGGGTFAASLLSAGVVDEIIGFTAGVILGAEGRPSIGALGIDALAEAPRYDLVSSERIGDDVMHHWRKR